MTSAAEPMNGFVQLKRGALAAIASTHKLSDKDFHLLFNLVDRADFRSQSVSNFAFSTWATDFQRCAKTVSVSFRKLEELNLVSSVKQPRNGLTVTILCWNEVVKGVKTKSGETAAKSGEVALKSGETAAKSGETALGTAKGLTTAKKYAPKIEDEDIRARGGDISTESDHTREQLERAFPTSAPSTIFDCLETLRSEGITEKTLKTATEQALGAKAFSLSWFMSRARSLHERETGSQSNQPTRPAEKEPSPWCEVCYIEKALTILKDSCSHSRGLQVVKDSETALVAV